MYELYNHEQKNILLASLNFSGETIEMSLLSFISPAKEFEHSAFKL